MTQSRQLSSPAAWRGQSVYGVLFDLDGTLLDTAADITLALNRALAEFGRRPLPVTQVSRMIGRGAPMLIERATAAAPGGDPPGVAPPGEAEKAAMLERFFHHYGALEENDESAAEPYPAVGDTLRLLHEADLRIAVVTNKHHRFATGLLQRLQFAQWVDVVVGGDTCERRKPDPQPLLFACAALTVAPSAALMIGDSVNDVRAARAAGIAVICVPYGYNEGQDPRQLPCDAIIETLADLPPMLWADA